MGKRKTSDAREVVCDQVSDAWESDPNVAQHTRTSVTSVLIKSLGSGDDSFAELIEEELYGLHKNDITVRAGRDTFLDTVRTGSRAGSARYGTIPVLDWQRPWFLCTCFYRCLLKWTATNRSSDDPNGSFRSRRRDFAGRHCRSFLPACMLFSVL